MSYYTKYRPQAIAELDLAGVRTELSKILTSGQFAHAYLFSGSKGTGKTSSARILAKVLNCEKNKEQLSRRSASWRSGSTGRRQNSSKDSSSTTRLPDESTTRRLVEPCNECDTCKRITNGSSLACVEMDGASNRRIDDVRVLIERIGLAPAEGLYTVYIIDEVHMLTTEAFNALLKTLEEPPAHAVFVLCTTDPQKIPDTVVSRCTRVLFSKASTEEVVHSLQKAVAGEGLEAEAGAVELLASRVDGSFRDGMKTLEQLAQNGRITTASVNELMGYGRDYDVQPLLSALVEQDAKAALGEVQKRRDMGVDPVLYTRRLLEETRDRLIDTIMTGKPEAGRWMRLARHLDEAAVRVKSALIPVLPLEVAVAEWCLHTGESENQRFSAPENQQTGKSEHQPIKKPPERPARQTTDKPASRPPDPPTLRPSDQPVYAGSLEEITGKWNMILASVRPLNHSLEALLRSARPASYEEGWLTVEAFYKFHKEQLEQDRYRRKLEEVIGSVLGGAIFLKFSLGSRVIKADPKVDNVSGSVDDEALVQAAEEIFGK